MEARARANEMENEPYSEANKENLEPSEEIEEVNFLTLPVIAATEAKPQYSAEVVAAIRNAKNELTPIHDLLDTSTHRSSV
jgi:hypothetical protein